MQTKSQDRKPGNDGKQQRPNRPARFAATTMGIRLTPDLLEWGSGEIAKDPEETWARMIRDGLRLLKKKREGLIQVLAPVSRP